MLINIDHKALEHACQCAGRSVHHFDRMGDDLPLRASIIAHARAIEQHEAFKREVSDAVETYADKDVHAPITYLGRFIIPKTDPLEKALEEAGYAVFPADLKRVRAAIEARGGRIVWEVR